MLFYREMAPKPEFGHLVLSFWEFITAGENFAPVQHEIFPDGCVSLLYYRNENFNLKRFILSGLYLESIVAPIFPTDIYWAMRISPAACAGLTRADPTGFVGKRMLEIEKFPHLSDDELLEKLNGCRNFDEAVAVFENQLKKIDLGEKPFDEKVEHAVKIIEQKSNEIKISELADQLNLSVRQLERRFKNSSGLTPKQYLRARRIRATAVDLIENQNAKWANRALEMGFSDQSHLTREFVSLTKRSPNSFAEKVKQIKHGNLIK
jgi:AraC-like DNA-binding protein